MSYNFKQKKKNAENIYLFEYSNRNCFFFLIICFAIYAFLPKLMSAFFSRCCQLNRFASLKMFQIGAHLVGKEEQKTTRKPS